MWEEVEGSWGQHWKLPASLVLYMYTQICLANVSAFASLVAYVITFMWVLHTDSHTSSV